MSSDYIIIDINNYHPESKQYFFDANVWKLILSPPISINLYEEPYIIFFDNLIKLRDKLLSKVAHSDPLPEIVITPLLISEIFNTLTRISFKDWLEDKKREGLSEERIKTLDYKRDYRKEEHYDNAIKRFTSDFLSHKDILIIMDDVNVVDLFNLLKNFPANTDFNDEYYYLFCYEKKISIITNDGDFIKAYVPIITNNNKLLRHANITNKNKIV